MKSAQKFYLPSVSDDECVIRELRNDAELAVELLKVALEEVDEEGGEYALKKTLHQIAKAHGIGKIAKKAGIPKESLSRALSSRGNPRLSTIRAITKAMGLHLTVRA